VVEKLVAHLEMTGPEQLRRAKRVPELDVIRVPDPAGADASRIRALHDAIATPHLWSSLGHSDELWQRSLASSERSHWIATVEGADIGWGSLASGDGSAIEIISFGIRPDVVGRGYGGAFLTTIVHEAWQRLGDAEASRQSGRVWLRTSSWDHPHALANYSARGFTVTHLEVQRQRAGTDSRHTTPVQRSPRFLVRPAVAHDASAVAALIANLGYQLPLETVRQRLGRFASSRHDIVAVVVEHPARVVGVISAHVVPLFAEAEPGFARITALSVSPTAVREGVGRRLVEFVEYAAGMRGIRLLEVLSGRREEREAAHRFYPALGFKDSASSGVRYWKHLPSTQ
jgi:GNAT superfamily N-acetyltransferase